MKNTHLRAVRWTIAIVLLLTMTAIPATTNEARAVAPAGSASNVARQWFDACSAPSLSAMQAWWPNSPLYAIGIYIGGSLRACSQPNLTASWVSQAHDVGYDFAPIWVGPQAPCSTFSDKISSTPSTAKSQGRTQASSAVTAANNLGIRSIIFYDMEYYSGSTACRDAVLSFMDGWSERLAELGRYAGGYSSACANMANWGSIPHPPAVIWFANWDGRNTVWNDICIGNNLWTNGQRHHQYQGPHNETWGGYTINIDRSCGNGLLAGSHAYGTISQPPGYPSCPAN